MNIIHCDVSLVIFLVLHRSVPLHIGGFNDKFGTFDGRTVDLADGDELHADNIEGLIDCSDIKQNCRYFSRSHSKFHIKKTDNES